MKIQKNRGGRVGGSGSVFCCCCFFLGGGGRCERRSEVFVKIQIKTFFFGGGGVGRGVRVHVNKEFILFL